MPRSPGRVVGTGLVLVLVAAGAFLGLAQLNRVINPRAQSHTEAADLPAASRVGQTGSSTCNDPSSKQEWRVDWKVTAAPPPGTPGTVDAQAGAAAIVPTGFESRSRATGNGGAPRSTLTPSTNVTLPEGLAAPALPGGWKVRDSDVWLLRWSPTLEEALKAAKDETWERAGPLTTLGDDAMTVGQSPRYVSPDGACTVFLVPFMAGTGTADQSDTVAVIGDSLVAQLYASLDGSVTGPGALQADLQALGYRPEINGQAGKRFTPLPGETGLESAEMTLFDEVRGLSSAHATVLAMGSNDAGWAALAPDAATYELRMSWVLFHLAPELDEIETSRRCTVLVTMAGAHRTYVNSLPGRFDDASRQINAYYRQRASASSSDSLRVFDWAALADPHGYGTADPWFGPDTIHLNTIGRQAYANALTQAAALC